MFNMIMELFFFNNLYLSESFNTNLHQLFDYKIKVLNLQRENTISLGNVVPKTSMKNVPLKDFWYTKLNLTQIWYEQFN